MRRGRGVEGKRLVFAKSEYANIVAAGARVAHIPPVANIPRIVRNTRDGAVCSCNRPTAARGGQRKGMPPYGDSVVRGFGRVPNGPVLTSRLRA